MQPKTLVAKVDEDGVLRLSLPLGIAIAGQDVKITIAPTLSSDLSQEAWRERIHANAGTWEGDFERPEQGEYEEREPFG